MSVVRSDRDDDVDARPARRTSAVTDNAIEVVVVEDDEDSRNMMLALLVANACHARGFATAADALMSSVARVPDVVISDLHLVGGAAGWELAEALRADPRTRDVALIAVTGEVEPERRIVTHFDAYLRKPIETKLLIDLVRQLGRIARDQRQRSAAT